VETGGAAGAAAGRVKPRAQFSYPVGKVNRGNTRESGIGASYHFPAEIMPPSGTKMSTKMEIGQLSEREELDVTFGAGELGMRLEERGDYRLVPVSVVTSLVPCSQAEAAGVVVGCTVVGVNGERYINHAHTVATLKHGRRPVKLRMRFPDA